MPNRKGIEPPAQLAPRFIQHLMRLMGPTPLYARLPLTLSVIESPLIMMKTIDYAWESVST